MSSVHVLLGDRFLLEGLRLVLPLPRGVRSCSPAEAFRVCFGDLCLSWRGGVLTV